MRFNLLDLLLPRETKFYTLLQEQATNFHQACSKFREILGQMGQLSADELQLKLASIHEFEKKGDSLERKIIDELDATFITPLDREDIHHIAMGIDKAMDMLDNLAGKMNIYRVNEAPADLITFADILCSISTELDNLLKALPEREGVPELIRVIHELEKRSDTHFHHTMAKLLDEKNSPIMVIKFKSIYEIMEDTVDAVDSIGKIIRGVMVKLG